VVLSLPSDPDNHLPLPQPAAEGPEDGEDEEALHQWAGGAFVEVRPTLRIQPAPRSSGLTPSAIEYQMGSGY